MRQPSAAVKCAIYTTSLISLLFNNISIIKKFQFLIEQTSQLVFL